MPTAPFLQPILSLSDRAACQRPQKSTRLGVGALANGHARPGWCARPRRRSLLGVGTQGGYYHTPATMSTRRLHSRQPSQRRRAHSNAPPPQDVSPVRPARPAESAGQGCGASASRRASVRARPPASRSPASCPHFRCPPAGSRARDHQPGLASLAPGSLHLPPPGAYNGPACRHKPQVSDPHTA